MDNLQLASFIKCQVRLLEKAFEESDGMMVGADRHEVFEYIGEQNGVIFDNMSRLSGTEHREAYPLVWSEESGTAKCLDPIRNEIESMKETIKILTGEK